MKKVPALLLMFLCSVSLFGDQVKPTTIDLMVELFQKVNEVHKKAFVIPDGEEYLSITREDIEKYPMAFLELVYHYGWYIYLSPNGIIRDLRESVLLSVIDYPIIPYTIDNFAVDRSKIGLMKEEDVEGYKHLFSNQGPHYANLWNDPDSKFNFHGALYASGTETNEAIIFSIIEFYLLYDLFKNKDIDLSGKSAEIQARVANRNWSSMEMLDSGDSIALLSVTNLDKESRKELLKKAKSGNSIKEARYQQARSTRRRGEIINVKERWAVPDFCVDYLRDGYTYKPETITRHTPLYVPSEGEIEKTRKLYQKIKNGSPNTRFFNLMTYVENITDSLSNSQE